MSVEVRYYSDPACTWSWAAEPALRRLIFEFEGELNFIWGMGGLARHFGSAYRDSKETSASQLLREADDELYRAKRVGRAS